MKPNQINALPQSTILSGNCKVTEREITAQDFSYASELISPLAFALGLSFGIALAFYVVVRAIGWVIGGFAGS